MFPHFSPDGRKISFTREEPPIDFLDEEIYTMKADGTGLVNLTNTTADEFVSDWQPVEEDEDDDDDENESD